jgi:hypothetical protein
MFYWSFSFMVFMMMPGLYPSKAPVALLNSEISYKATSHIKAVSDTPGTLSLQPRHYNGK